MWDFLSKVHDPVLKRCYKCKYFETETYDEESKLDVSFYICMKRGVLARLIENCNDREIIIRDGRKK